VAFSGPRGTFLYRTESRDGVRVTRCRVYVPRNPLPLRRVAHEVSWMLAAAVPVSRLVAWADVWLVVTPSFGSAVLGALIAEDSVDGSISMFEMLCRTSRWSRASLVRG